jgi:hypothetical protein
MSAAFAEEHTGDTLREVIGVMAANMMLVQCNSSLPSHSRAQPVPPKQVMVRPSRPPSARQAIALEIQQRPSEHGHRRYVTRTETENGRVNSTRAPVKNRGSPPQFLVLLQALAVSGVPITP